MRQLAKSTIEKRVQGEIDKIKFLNDPKYFKNNYWNIAHFESWAARGQDGGCQNCNNHYYNASLYNKRHNNKHSSHGNWRQEIVKICYSCKKIFEEKIGVEFIHKYAP
jgi:hypothetical protein